MANNRVSTPEEKQDSLVGALSTQRFKDLLGSQNVPIDEVLKQLQARKLLKEFEEDDRKAAEAERLRLARIKQIEKDLEEKALQQASCNHLKENGKTRLVGQRDSNNQLLLVCQQCQKEWVGMPPEAHLQPDPNHVGGPA